MYRVFKYGATNVFVIASMISLVQRTQLAYCASFNKHPALYGC